MHDASPDPRTDAAAPDPARGRTRRDVLAAGAAGGLLAAAALWWEGLAPGLARRPLVPTPPGAPARGLDEPTWRTLAAAQDRLLPSTPDAPGAAATNAIGYLDAAFASPDVAEPVKLLLRRGAAHVDRAARWYRKDRFHELDGAQQDAILRSLERDTRIGLPWLRTMIMYTLEGFLGDPVHGGNAGEAAWRWLGHVPGVPRPTAPHFRLQDRAR